MSDRTKRILIQTLPYLLVALLCTNVGEAWRLAEGTDASARILSFLAGIGAAFANPLPSIQPFDLLIGLCCGGAMRLAVYLKGRNAKKYRHNEEYGSAR